MGKQNSYRNILKFFMIFFQPQLKQRILITVGNNLYIFSQMNVCSYKAQTVGVIQICDISGSVTKGKRGYYLEGEKVAPAAVLAILLHHLQLIKQYHGPVVCKICVGTRQCMSCITSRRKLIFNQVRHECWTTF